MGWASGSELAESIWRNIRTFIPKADRKSVARIIIRSFENADCDTMDEAITLLKDAGQ